MTSECYSRRWMY